MATTTATELIPADILEDLREGTSHAAKARESATKHQKQAAHEFGVADGILAETERRAARKMGVGPRDVFDIDKGTITRVVDVADPPSPPDQDPFEDVVDTRMEPAE